MGPECALWVGWESIGFGLVTNSGRREAGGLGELHELLAADLPLTRQR